MNSPTSGNPGAAGSTGDLWKKVLDEVQTEAAARRNKVAAKAASAPPRTGAELDLLKRILTVVEAKAAPTVVQAPPDRSAEILAQFLPKYEALLRDQLREQLPSAAPSTDLSPLLEQIIASIKAQPRVESKDIIKPIVEAIERQQPAAPFEELREDLSKRITQAIESTPKPVDVSPQLQAILEAIRNQPALDPSTITTPLLAAISQQQPVDVQGPLRELSAKFETQLSALPKPVDPTPQLQAILAAIQSLPAPQPVNEESISQKIAQALEGSKPADITPQLQSILAAIQALPAPTPVNEEALAQRITEAFERAKPADLRDDLALLRAELAAIPRPSDTSAKLDDLLAAVKHRPDDGRDEVLLQILEAAQKPQPNHAETLAKIQEQLAALAQRPGPADVSPQLQAILESVQSQPRVDVEGVLQKAVSEFRATVPTNQDSTAQLALLASEIQRVREESTQFSQRIATQLEALTVAGQSNPAMDEVLTLLRAKATQTDDALLWRILQAVEQPPKNGTEKSLAAQSDLLQQILAKVQAVPASDASATVREELASHTAKLHEELAKFRDGFQQEIAKQNAAVREDLIAHSIEVIDQIKSQSPASIEESLRQIRAEVAALPKPVDPAPQVAAGLEVVLAAIRSQPVAQPLDVPSLVAEIRSAMPQPLSLATLPVVPSYKSEFARQEEMLRQLMVEIQMQHEVGENPAADAIAELRGELKSLSDANRRTQHLIEQSLTSATTKLESRLESRLNSGLAKIELAIATADTGRPASLSGDGANAAPSANYSYSWMSQSPQRNRTPAIALTVTAVAAVGMFLVLLINALTGGNDNPPANPGGNNGSQLASNNTSTTTPDSKKSTPVATNDKPKTIPVTPTTNIKDEVEKGPIKLFHDPANSKDGSPVVAAPIVDEIRNLTNPGATRSRVVYEIPQAKQIVFLVHASGGSVTTLTTMLAELKKNLAIVKPNQKFTVIFSEGKRFIEAPPNGLRDGTDSERSRMETWIDLNVRSATVRAATNPLVAIDVAISYSPDLLWIVSDGLAGDGIGHVSSKEILERIAALNPDGAIRIAATQVGSPDAAATLKTLAEKYGGAYVVTGDGTSASRVP